MFNPKEVADNLKKSGAFIPGYRPGDQTAKHIDTILTRLTVVGSLYMTAICLCLKPSSCSSTLHFSSVVQLY